MTQEQAFRIMRTGVNIFLTGSAGSGKTFLLNRYIKYCRSKNISVAITASTGIAATHMNGMTIHSWSGIGIRSKLNDYDLDNLLSKEYLSKRIKNTSVLIIDEISMLDAAKIDMIDLVCRKVRMNDLPFGGIQVILSGDFFQLPPVVKNEQLFENEKQIKLLPNQEEIEQAEKNRATNSRAWQTSRMAVCYLTEQFRQDDNKFLEILNSIRADNLNEKHFKMLEERMNIKFPLGTEPTKLYTRNVDVDKINHDYLAKIGGEERILEMNESGTSYLVEILKKGCLAPEKLHLKIGAEVMFLKNNFEKGYVNGTRGKVYTFLADSSPIIILRNGEKITVEREDWVIEENGHRKALISQFPLRLAWAITIHKSQGMSLDYAEMDLANTFAYGMGYVALSRVKTLDGVRLVGFERRALLSDPKILEADKFFQKESSNNGILFDSLKNEEQEKMEQDFINRASTIGQEKKKSKNSNFSNVDKKYSVENIRQKYPNAYTPWSLDDDTKLRKLFKNKTTLRELQKIFGRQRGSINSRLIKLGLKEENRVLRRQKD